MNKLLFNEGGQPVFLDDLEMIQAEPLNQTGMLLKALGAGTSMFLMDGFTGKYLDNDVSGKNTYAVNRNWLVVDGTVYELPATNIVIGEGETLYVGLKTTEGDERNFDDGQSRACVERTTAYYSTTKTDDGMVEVKSLKTLWELTAPYMKAAMPTDDYTDVNVKSENGYSGKVQYKDIGDAYRVKIDIKSEASSWQTIGDSKDTSLFVFKAGSAPFISPIRIALPYCSPLLGAPNDITLEANSGRMYLMGIDKEAYPPYRCDIKVIVEILK